MQHFTCDSPPGVAKVTGDNRLCYMLRQPGMYNFDVIRNAATWKNGPTAYGWIGGEAVALKLKYTVSGGCTAESASMRSVGMEELRRSLEQRPAPQE